MRATENRQRNYSTGHTNRQSSASDPEARAAMTSKFFRFPIGCLRLDKSLHEIDEADRQIILNRCLNFHLFDAMKQVDAEDEQVTAAADDEAVRQGYTTPNDEWSDDEIALLYSLRISNINKGEKDTSKILRGIRKSVAEVTTGKSRVVFPAELFWEAVQQWDFREFAVLCAVWSAIGEETEKKPFKILSYAKFIRGSLGYGTEVEFEKLPKHVKPLTRDQVIWTVDKLELRRFFVRCPKNKRHNAYSKKLGLFELQRAIAEQAAMQSRPTQAKKLAEVERLTASILASEASKSESQQQPVNERPAADRQVKPATSRPAISVQSSLPKAQPNDQEIADRIREIERLAE